jgi:hypothetical protein
MVLNAFGDDTLSASGRRKIKISVIEGLLALHFLLLFGLSQSGALTHLLLDVYFRFGLELVDAVAEFR